MRCLNNVLENFFYNYAGYVTKYAYFFIITPIVITGMLSGGLYFKTKMDWNNTEEVSTPKDGPAKYEKQIFAEHFPLEEDNHVPGQSFEVKHFVHITVTSKNQENPNLLRDDILDAIEDLNRYVLDRHTVASYDGLYNITYSMICLKSESKCFENEHIWALRNRDNLESVGYLVRYPISRVPPDNPAYIAGLINSVTLNDTEGRIQKIRAIQLVYFMKHTGAFYYYGNQFRDTLTEYLKNYKSDLFKISFAHEESYSDGLQENEKRFLPEIGVTISLVLLFSYMCSFTFMKTSEGTYIDWVKSKPLLAVVGTMEPGLAIMSTLGLLLFAQVPYNAIVVVMPFLVFAIGVDDMFIMISSWHNTNINDPPEKRFAQALSEAGVSITITSVTDVIAFSVGIWNPIPLIQIYCGYTAVAMFFELIYQCTFYAAALYLIGSAESRGLHCMTWKKAQPLSQAQTKFQRRFCIGTIVGVNNKLVHKESNDDDDCKVSSTEARFEYPVTDDDGNVSLIQNFFRNYYGPILLKPVTKFFVAGLFATYLTFSIWGVLTMPNGLKTEELIPETHYSQHWMVENLQHSEGMPMQILVNNPPDLTTPKNRVSLYEMVKSFENTAHTLDERYTMFWLEEYERWIKGGDNSSAYKPESVKLWLVSLSHPAYWKSCIEFTKDNRSDIRSFRFSVGLKDYGSAPKHHEAVVLIRNLLEKYPEFNLTCFQKENPYVDNYMIVYSITIRNTIISLAIIIGVTMFLIPHPVCCLFMTICVLSIDVGVSGFLSWWGVNMDCISMIGMIMATGFAVDFSAHISYAYIRAEGTANQKAIRALETLGWPVFQGVTATLLGVLIMGTVDAYMFEVFFKTVFLVIVFGLLHSIVFLPVALTGFVPRNLDCCKKNNDRRLTESPISDLSTKEVLLNGCSHDDKNLTDTSATSVDDSQ